MSINKDIVNNYIDEYDKIKKFYSEIYEPYVLTLKVDYSKNYKKILKESAISTFNELEKYYFTLNNNYLKLGFPKIVFKGGNRKILFHYHVFILLPNNYNLIIKLKKFFQESLSKRGVTYKEEFFYQHKYYKGDSTKDIFEYGMRDEEEETKIESYKFLDLGKIEDDFLNFKGYEVKYENDDRSDDKIYLLHEKNYKEFDYIVKHYDEDFSYLYKQLDNLEKINYIKKLDPIESKSLSLRSAREKFKKVFNDTLNSNKKISLIDSFVGVGKSESIKKIDLDKYKDKRFLVVMPKHSNIEDFFQKEITYKNSSINYLVNSAVRLPDYDPELKLEIEDIYKKGFEPNIYLKEENKLLHNRYININKIRSEILENSRVVVTTHEKYLSITSKYEFDYIIIDEDITPSVFNEKLLSYSTLITLMNEINNINRKPINHIDNLKKLNNFLQFNLESEVFLSIGDDLKDSIRYIINSDNIRKKFSLNTLYSLRRIDEFFQCDSFYYSSSTNELKFISKRSLLNKNDNSKIIILTATYEKIFYDKLFKDIEYLKIDKPDLKANVYQNYSKNYSNSKIKKNIDDCKEDIKKFKSDGFEIITFKSLDKDSLINIHSSSGLNHFEGKNLMILGTPLISPISFNYILNFLGIKYTEIDINLINIRLNNYEFSIYGFYKEYDINKLYYSLANNLLIQAVGRCRPYNYDCNVVIYSGIPQEDSNVYCSPKIIDSLLKKKEIEKNIKESQYNALKFRYSYFDKDRKLFEKIVLSDNTEFTNYFTKINKIIKQSNWLNDKNIKKQRLLYNQDLINSYIENKTLKKILIFETNEVSDIINSYLRGIQNKEYIATTLTTHPQYLDEECGEVIFLNSIDRDIEVVFTNSLDIFNIEKTLDKIYLFHQKDRIKVIHPLKSILNFKGDVKKSIKYSISINNYNRLEEFYNNNSYLDTQTPNLIFKLRDEINEKLVFEEEMNNLTLKGRTISKFVKLKYDIDSNKVNLQEILNNIYTILYKNNIDGISINIKNYNDFINKLFNCDISKLLSNISKYLDGTPM